MTSIIKYQIIKHLSKFARNVTADQISVQILSGKGELKNIELNEVVLTEVLELPTWLRIKRAGCNRVAVKVPWTRLKSSPVQLFVDEIQVEVELTSEAPLSSGSNPLSSFADSSYGFANRVVEGMSLYVNTVEIHFDSGVFGGSLMLSRLSVESKSPGWQPIGDLRYSRIVDPGSSQMLMFKQVTWQLLRIEASAQAEPSQRANINAPLRLITSNGKSRIAVKKSSIDGTVLGGRIQTILEDILWVATLPQVRSAIAFYNHIMKLVRAAPKKTDFQTQQHNQIKPPSATSRSSTPNLVSKAFRNFDFSQTSYHLYVGKIDLHLCDDANASSGYPEDWNIESGALQVTLVRLSIDFYPANVASSDRLNWVRYSAPNQCSTWIQQILKAHYKLLCSRLDINAQNRLARIWPQLLSQNCVLRIHDVVVQCVTDMNSKRDALFNLFMSDRKSKASLPSDQPLVHLEFASFYHPATETMPMPPNATHLLLGPFSFLLDQRTIRWVLYAYEDINNALQCLDASLGTDYIPKTDIRIDLLMPKVIIPLDGYGTRDARMPRRLVVSMSTVLATNCESAHSQDACSFFSSLSANIVDFVDATQLPLNASSFRNFIIQLNQSEIIDSVDGVERFWISTSPIWIDTDRGESSRSTPLLGDVALHAICDVSTKQVNIAVQPQCRVRAVIDHFQYVQLTRLLSTMSLFVDQLDADQKFFSSGRSNGGSVPFAILCLIEQVELNVVLARGAIISPYATHVGRDQSNFSPTISGGAFDCLMMDQIPSEVLQNILERLPESERIPASFTCRRWLSLLSRSYPRTLEIRINLDASSCNAKFNYSTTHETHITICSCATHAREHALILRLLFEQCGDEIRSVSIDDDLIPKEGVQCHLEDLTFHSVLRNAPSTISALHIRGVNLSKIHAWTLALIAKFACLEEISLCGCILPIGNESMLSRLIAPSFHSLASISVTDSNQISDKFVTTIARRCPLLRDVNVSGCERVTALSLIAFCECATSRRTELTSINMCSTSFDFNMLERYLCSPLLVGGNYWVATPMKIEIAYERAAVCLENTRFRSLLIIAYV